MKGNILENIDLKKYNSYGIGGIAKYLVMPNNIEELKDLVEYLKENKVKYYILGSGTNVILPDEDFDGVIIKLDKLNNMMIEDGYLYADAGINLSNMINSLLELGYVNLTNLYGIPGTLGGAIIGNAGSFGSEIFDFIKSVTILDNGYIETINKDNIKYEYRNTEFKNSDKIILGAVIKLEKGDINKAKEILKNNIEKRKNGQPLEYRNAGSVFKNPNNMSAGRLIEDCNLKDYHINGAYVSNKHANFIINKDNATSKDIIELIDYIKKYIKDNKGIELELEQVIVKW